jgi:hypothetical protein
VTYIGKGGYWEGKTGGKEGWFPRLAIKEYGDEEFDYATLTKKGSNSRKEHSPRLGEYNTASRPSYPEPSRQPEEYNSIKPSSFPEKYSPKPRPSYDSAMETPVYK